MLMIFHLKHVGITPEIKIFFFKFYENYLFQITLCLYVYLISYMSYDTYLTSSQSTYGHF